MGNTFLYVITLWGIVSKAEENDPVKAYKHKPKIKPRLDAASPSIRSDKLHFKEMAWQIVDNLTVHNQNKPL